VAEFGSEETDFLLRGGAAERRCEEDDNFFQTERLFDEVKCAKLGGRTAVSMVA